MLAKLGYILKPGSVLIRSDTCPSLERRLFKHELSRENSVFCPSKRKTDPKSERSTDYVEPLSERQRPDCHLSFAGN